MRLLMVEDDHNFSDAIAFQLRKAGYEVDVCDRGDEAEYYLEGQMYDVILLDRMLPGKDGITILREIRKKCDTPVILVTALDSVGDKVTGLDAGADDYLAKPFEIEELEARLRAVLRRPPKAKENEYYYADIELKPGTRQLVQLINGKQLKLTKKEFLMVELFLKNQETMITREQIFHYVWGPDSMVAQANVDTYVHFIRQHLQILDSRVQIQTFHGSGYCMTENG